MTKSKGNEYYTPKYVWENIKKYIPKDKIIYEPFNNINFPQSLKSHQYLKELGFKMKPLIIFDPVTSKNDFFKNKDLDYDIVVSNPPFSIKQAIIKRLVKLDKPFILIAPIETISNKYISDLSDNIEVIIPKKRMNFAISNKKKSGAIFPTAYICYKMNIGQKMIYV